FERLALRSQPGAGCVESAVHVRFLAEPESTQLSIARPQRTFAQTPRGEQVWKTMATEIEMRFLSEAGPRQTLPCNQRLHGQNFLRKESGVEFETDGNGEFFKQHAGFELIAAGQRTEIVLASADDGGHAQHALPVEASELIFEISGDHIGEL